MKRFPLVSMLGGPTPAIGSPATPETLNGSRSMRRDLCLLFLVVALPASAADRAEEVRATEIAFAKAFADRDAKKFFFVPRRRRSVSRTAQHYAREARSDRGLVRILQTSSRTFPLAARARRNKRRWRPGILQRSRFR